MPLFLTSLVFDGLGGFLARHTHRGPVCVITNASRELDDQHAIVSLATDALAGLGYDAVRLDVRAADPSILAQAGAVVMTGGDPFRLLADLRASGAKALLSDAHGRGIPIVGQSAGAIVCGPNLGPIRITSPFTAPADLDLTGLNFVDRLVLPHHGRPGRGILHRRAALPGGRGLTVLWDDEVLVTGAGAWHIRRGANHTRPAQLGDACALGDVFHQAALTAWGPFLGREGLEAQRQDASIWCERIEQGAEQFLVTEDEIGLAGFVRWRALDASTGEVDLLYTHPRTWRRGIGRRLLERATWNLLCEGFREAVLWTEARNERALAVYRANGWKPDGAVDEREFAGAPVRNLRHRLDLTELAGGV